MAWSWDEVTLAFNEEPISGQVDFVRRRVWAFANPRGSDKRLKQKLHNDSREIRLRLILSETTVGLLQAKYELDTAVLHVNPRPPYDTGVLMLMTEFTAVWDPTVPGEDVTEDGVYFNCNMVMVED